MAARAMDDKLVQIPVPGDAQKARPGAALRRRRLGEILVDAGVITLEQLAEALGEQKRAGRHRGLGQVLVDMGCATERGIGEALALQLGLRYVDLRETVPDEQAMLLLPEHLARRFQTIPIAIDGDKLTVGMVDPLDVLALDDVHTRTAREIEPVVITPEDFQRAINQYPALDESVETVITEIKAKALSKDEMGVDQLRALVDEAPVVRLVNMIILQAIRQRASDIHIEPQEFRMRVRYRIDGALYNVMTPARDIQAAVISRVKIMADIDIAERRVPQDGRIAYKAEGKDYDLRVSTIPTVFGEKVVMRILDKSATVVGLERVGLLPVDFPRFDAMISRPHGIILLTGPTGSGKSTTLYSILNRLNSTESNIITVEDPVEYQLPGINQVQVNPKAGLTFANGLRSFLRQDPDIIMVGEVRDEETARITIHAALTGHLVLSTLHTNDAPGAVARLVDMGIEPFLVASSMVGVIAQRLVRVLCDRCKQPYLPPAELLDRFGALAAEQAGAATFYRPQGCDHCGNIGYLGRTALFEIMSIDDTIRSLVTKQASVADVRQAAIRAGMRTLGQDGFTKVLLGITSAEEVLRAVYVED
ncbi:MAG TPA: type II secretion system ATPase GspE [bacterium]|nr:type II secretion system ATPase GspE [bacterium]